MTPREGRISCRKWEVPEAHPPSIPHASPWVSAFLTRAGRHRTLECLLPFPCGETETWRLQLSRTGQPALLLPVLSVHGVLSRALTSNEVSPTPGLAGVGPHFYQHTPDLVCSASPSTCCPL